MLLRYGAKNFYCFKEGIEISLELGAKCPEDISRGNPVANLLCIKGANGSGKTNALKVLGFLKDFCCHSFNNKPEDDILIDSFFLNDDPIDLFCDFIFKDTQYHYELCLTSKMVISEKLSRRVYRLTPVFERKGNELTSCIKEFADLKTVKQRTNASIISTAHQYETTSLFPIYKFFYSIITNVAWSGRVDFSSDYRGISEYYNNNPGVFERAVEIIKASDMGISNIKIHKSDEEEENGKKYHYPIFEHDANIDNNWLTFHSQALGTQALYRTIPYYIHALNTGGILAMDEFDIAFHPHILPTIVNYFDNEEVNIKNAQMLFSTHNTDILEYMGKYRTVLVNKESSESYVYRLDEIPGDIIRNDRPIAPVYNSGRIGGVPKI